MGLTDTCLSAILPDDSNLDLFNLENSPLHIHWKDEKGRYIACNKRVVQDAGFNKMDDLLGLTDLDFNFLPEVMALKFRRHDELIRKTGQSQFFIEPILLASNKRMVAISHKAPLHLQSKKNVGIATSSFIVEMKDSVLTQIPSLIGKDSAELTKRQASCLYHLVRGMTMKQIAAALNLSPKTVEHYLDAIKIKLNCSSRSELVIKALEMGFGR